MSLYLKTIFTLVNNNNNNNKSHFVIMTTFEVEKSQWVPLLKMTKTNEISINCIRVYFHSRRKE